jgi:hypothetical protein
MALTQLGQIAMMTTDLARFQGFPSFGDVRHRGVKQAQTCTGIAEDRGERLVDLMRDRSRKLPQRRNPRDACEVGLCLPQRALGLLGPDLGCDIGGYAAVAQERSVHVEHGLAAHGDIERRSVRACNPVPEVAKGLVRFERGEMSAPLLRLVFTICGELPTSRANESPGNRPIWRLSRKMGERVAYEEIKLN